MLPVAKHHFDLSAGEFRDALAMRYGRSLLSMPSVCDGCGELFTLGHALDCKKGGLVTQRHNEVRDALGDMAALAYRDVVREPIVRESDGESMLWWPISALEEYGSLRLQRCLTYVWYTLTLSPMWEDPYKQC